MDFNEYQKLSKRTMPDIYDPLSRLNAAMGLAGEAGETCEVVKKNFFHGHETDVAVVIKEAGDVLWYLGFLAETYGFTLEEVATMNVEKLRTRFPEGFSTEASIKRVDVDKE